MDNSFSRKMTRKTKKCIGIDLFIFSIFPESVSKNVFLGVYKFLIKCSESFFEYKYFHKTNGRKANLDCKLKHSNLHNQNPIDCDNHRPALSFNVSPCVHAVDQITLFLRCCNHFQTHPQIFPISCMSEK